MSAPRLLFLYPVLFNPTSKSSRVLLRQLNISTRPRPAKSGATSKSHQVRHVTLTRHGSAVEPVMPEDMKMPPGAQSIKETKPTIPLSSSSITPPPSNIKDRPLESLAKSADSNDKHKEFLQIPIPSDNQPISESKALEEITNHTFRDEKMDKKDASNIRGAAQKQDDETVKLDTQAKNVKEVKPPEGIAAGKIPVYYHNFDTYTMVKQLTDAGFTYEQSVVAMKLIRGMLSLSLNRTKEKLVTKSNVENELYLFRAACSELRTEVQNSRRTTLDKTRLERAQLQHDYDQLVQRFSEDLVNLKDEVQSMFNNRKMVTREEQRTMEVKIQELNYKLTILLNGDLRTEIESLRWTTTRRGLVAILVLAITIVTFMKLSGAQHKLMEEKAAEAAAAPTHSGEGALAEALITPRPNHEVPVEDRPFVKPHEGDEAPPFVSLG